MDERPRVLALLERHGWNATSFQILEPGFSYWFDGDDACVGYVDTGRAWVAAGPPIAPAERLAEVSARFRDAAIAAHRRVCCFATEARFAGTVDWRSLRIGDQPIWDPAAWAGVLKERSSLREQLRRARAKGVTVRALSVASPGSAGARSDAERRGASINELDPAHPTRMQIDALIARWLATRPIAPMGFLVQVDPFTFPERRHYFVAERAGRVVGFLGVIPIYARRGWFFEDFLRDGDAPNGTVEMLIDAGMRAAAAELVPFVTLGLVPLSGDVAPTLRAARRLGRALYDFDGLRAFKAKFAPSGWDPIFLSYPSRGSSVLAVVDTLTAFARGGLFRFGIETLLRGPAIVIRVLAALLLVWTVLLALPVAAPWFPSAWWQYGWVGFDVALGGALLALAHRWRQPLADIVASVVTADAIVTLAQAIVYDLPEASTGIDYAVIVVAILAPTFAAILLWNARARREATRLDSPPP
jgi:phosphatidylglycerol lysyltransferase